MGEYVEIFGVWFAGGSVESREGCEKVLRTLATRISRAKSPEDAEELRTCRAKVTEHMVTQGWRGNAKREKYPMGMSLKGLSDAEVLGGKKSWACRRNTEEQEAEYWRWYREDAKRKGWGAKMVKEAEAKHRKSFA